MDSLQHLYSFSHHYRQEDSEEAPQHNKKPQLSTSFLQTPTSVTMQTKTITLTLVTLASAVLASPASTSPDIAELEKIAPGSQASFDTMMEKDAATLQERGIEKRCLYKGKNKCNKCMAGCGKKRYCSVPVLVGM